MRNDDDYNFEQWAKDTYGDAGLPKIKRNPGLSENIGDASRLLLKGTAGVGGVVGYGLEKTGIAPEYGRELQESDKAVQDKLQSKLTPVMQEASQQPLINEDGSYNKKFGWRSLESNVLPSVPGSVVMGVAGAPLAAAAESGALGLGVSKAAAPYIGSGLGFGASEGVFSGAQNAEQWGQEQRAKDISEFEKHPNWNMALAANNNDPVAAKEALINQGQSDILKDTAVKTGGISSVTGGGFLGALRKGFAPAASGAVVKAGALEAAKDFTKETGKSMGLEGLQEAPQSYFEQRTTNQATKDYVDPNQDVNQGAVNAGLVGGLSGAAMGAVGGVGVFKQRSDELNKQALIDHTNKVNKLNTAIADDTDKTENLANTQGTNNIDDIPATTNINPAPDITPQVIDDPKKPLSSALNRAGTVAPPIEPEAAKTLPPEPSFYDKAFESLSNGSTAIDGAEHPLLAKAKPYFDAGLIKSPAQFENLVNHPEFNKDEQTDQDIQPTTKSVGGNDRPEPVASSDTVNRNDAGIHEQQSAPKTELAEDNTNSGPGALTTAPEIKPVTPKAVDLLNAVDNGGVPVFLSNNLKHIATQNEIPVTKDTTPNSIINELRDRAEHHGQIAPKTEPVEKQEKPKTLRGLFDTRRQNLEKLGSHPDDARTVNIANKAMPFKEFVHGQILHGDQSFEQAKTNFDRIHADQNNKPQPQDLNVQAKEQNIQNGVSTDSDVSVAPENEAETKQAFTPTHILNDGYDTPAVRIGDNLYQSATPIVDKEKIDRAAHQAATSPLNNLPEPTEAQKESGDYKKGHINLHGLDIAIENPKGSIRSGVDQDGKAWSNEIKHHYGYIKRTNGADGDEVDVFVGEHPESTKAFVVNQINPKTGKFDEHKVMLGFNSKGSAKAGYLRNYAKGWKGAELITELSIDELKQQIEEGKLSKPKPVIAEEAIEYKGIRIYPTKAGGKYYFAIETEENKQRRLTGDRNRGGDRLVETIEEAKAEIYREELRQQDRKKHEKQVAEQDKNDATEKAARDDIDGFRDDDKPNVRALAIKTLNSNVNYNNQITTIKDVVRNLVANGGKTSTEEVNRVNNMTRTQYNRADAKQQAEHERRVKEGGKKTVYYVDNHDLGKTAYDYANFLIEKGSEETKQPQTTVTKDEQWEEIDKLTQERLDKQKTKANSTQNLYNDTEEFKGLVDLFKQFGKIGQIKPNNKALKNNPQADKIVNIQKYWTDVVSDYAYGDDDGQGNPFNGKIADKVYRVC